MKVYIGTYRKNRSIKVKIDKYDTWSLYHTLTLIILPSLKQFRKHHCGSPIIEGHFDPKTFKTKPSLHKAWNDILDEMIWSFESILKEDEMDRNFTKEEYKKINRGLHLFATYYRNLWD